MKKIQKKKQSSLTISIDLGGSLTKVVGGVNFQDRVAFTMEPHLAQVPPEILTNIIGLDQANLEDKVWIEVENKTYAVGYLAKTLTVTNSQLKALKSTSAIPKILGAIWVLKEKYKFSNYVNINLSCLLPPGEIKDREKLSNELSLVFSQGIDTPTGKFTPKLNYYHCFAEGSGIYLLHRAKKGREQVNSQVVAVIMLGYRNGSVMVFRRGIVNEYQTTELGFSRLIKAMVKQLSGQTIDRLTPAIARHRETGSDVPLHSVLLSDSPQQELEQLKKVLEVSQISYEFELINWLKETLPSDVEEIILCGGTSDDPCIKTKLFEHFNDKNIYLHAQVELPSDVEALGLGKRFGDVWCIWDYTLSEVRS